MTAEEAYLQSVEALRKKAGELENTVGELRSKLTRAESWAKDNESEIDALASRLGDDRRQAAVLSDALYVLLTALEHSPYLVAWFADAGVDSCVEEDLDKRRVRKAMRDATEVLAERGT